MNLARRIISALKRLFPRTGAQDPRLPSLLRAMQELVPRSVMKEVVASANDRRQWGVLAAAWIGVSEREFMQAAARHLHADFFERIPNVDVSLLGPNARQLLDALRKCAAVPVSAGDRVIRMIAVDPAEVRGCPIFDGTQELAIGCWSDICRALDQAERALSEGEVTVQQVEAKRKDELSCKVLEVLMQEASAHGATSVEVLGGDERPRYQFVTHDGKRGHGTIHKGVIPDLLSYLSRSEGAAYESKGRGSIVIRSLGSLTTFRLSWAADVAPLVLLPAESGPTVADTHRPTEFEATKEVPATESITPRTVPEEPAREEMPVLVVDDNPMFSRVLERLLQRDGYSPWFAENGAVALEKLESSRSWLPKAIICDLHMPVMNGKELVAKLRQDPRYSSVPVVMLTSDDDVEAEVSLLGIGADAFLSKTKDPRILCAQVRRLTQLAKLRDAA